MSLSGHQSARMKSDTWLTPPHIVGALGEFDLDPCCPPNMPWATAKMMLSLPTDGLATPWQGRIWLNPPFGDQAGAWVKRLADHGNGIALVAARTETKWFFESIWARADAVCFLRTRPHFHFADGGRAPFNSGAPICLAAFGSHNRDALLRADLGQVVDMIRDRKVAA